MKMYRQHHLLVRKLSVSFPSTAKLLKVSGMMQCLIFYLFQLLSVFFVLVFFANLTLSGWRQIGRKFLCVIPRNTFLFLEPEMHQG